MITIEQQKDVRARTEALNRYLYPPKKGGTLKRMLLYIGILLACCAAVSCRSSREEVSASANPYLNRYLAVPADSASLTVSDPAQATGRLNDEQLHEQVNPEKEASWADVLSRIMDYFWPGRR